MKSGLLPDWEPAEGRTTIWRVHESSRRAIQRAPERPAWPSYIQRRHFIDAAGSSGSRKRRSSFAVLSFEVHGEYRADLLERVFTEHLRRHGVYHTWMRETPEGYRGRTIDPADIALQSETAVDARADLRVFIQENLPDITEWDMFLFAATGTEHAGPEAPDPRFTVVFVVDHFYTDGLSLGIILYEMVTAYRALLRGQEIDLPTVESYEVYCDAEARHSGSLDLRSEPVRAWLEFVEREAGRLPSFPLPLGLDPAIPAAGASTVLSEFASADECDSFAAVCKAAGANAHSGVMAIAALIHRAATGRRLFSTLTPVSTRLSRTQIFSVGWYTRLVPVQFDLGPAGTVFAQAAARAHTAIAESKRLIHTPLHRVAELMEPLGAGVVTMDFAAPMISYLDTRSMPGNDLVSRHKMAVHGSVDDSREVFLWANRTREGMDLTFIHPDTPVARASVNAYAEAFRRLFLHVARTGSLPAQVQERELAPVAGHRQAVDPAPAGMVSTATRR